MSAFLTALSSPFRILRCPWNPLLFNARCQSRPERASAAKARPEQEFFCFRVGDLRLGVPSENVREVLRAGPAHAAAAHARLHPGRHRPPRRGAAGAGPAALPGQGRGAHRSAHPALRGRLRHLRGRRGGGPVLGLRRIPVADILPPPMGGDAATEHLLGVVSRGRPRGRLNLLNFTKLLQPRGSGRWRDDRTRSDELRQSTGRGRPPLRDRRPRLRRGCLARCCASTAALPEDACTRAGSGHARPGASRRSCSRRRAGRRPAAGGRGARACGPSRRRAAAACQRAVRRRPYALGVWLDGDSARAAHRSCGNLKTQGRH